ncbi:general stress protein [Staphylococcus warneri]|uniref:general stress protein n=1 Tax=Staphylococcus warneri TaxID=1292 RepID=UPI001FB1C805|nr:general stress protein [Staphylococcus warneri]MCJ1787606.1 general stress protein [Staphylococcus warneri]MCJ1790099.1 general stress protein [Staphylococcus warneri]MCJ1792498.1 general stress protein [Staphylococcus warneri]MCJ1794986.1 general stress protein [Staphylococcus warneri]MCJ1797308.1 general stress protein [Staphylococcus warneri]
MAEITVVKDKSELYNVINQKKSEGYLESELAVISRSKLHLDDLHDSQISLIATSGSFSDRMSRLLIGEDGEQAVLTRYDLTDEEIENHKQDILDNKILVVARRDRSSHNEVEENNAAYEELDITHYAAESKGSKA